MGSVEGSGSEMSQKIPGGRKFNTHHLAVPGRPIRRKRGHPFRRNLPR